MILKKNINLFKEEKEAKTGIELFTTLCETDNVKIKKIVSYGYKAKADEWYIQECDEWVVVIEGWAKLAFDNSVEVSMKKGEHIFIPSNCKHKVIETSSNPPCLWLAVYIEHQ